MANDAWTDKSAIRPNYMWINTGVADATTAGDHGWTFRVNPVHWGEGYVHEVKWAPTTIDAHTVPIPSVEYLGTGFDAEEFEERIKGEMMQMVQKYVSGMLPMLIDVIRNAPSMLGQKKITDGYFCFNCGSPIRKGKETEECAYCGT